MRLTFLALTRNPLTMPRSLVLASLLVAAPLLHGDEPPAGSVRRFAPPEEAPALKDLTRDARQRADRLALREPLDKPAERAVDLAGNVSAWLIKHLSLTDSEEADAARKVHQELLLEHKRRVKQAPRLARQTFDRLVAELPPHLKPEAFRYSLTVLDLPEVAAFTCGGGCVCVTQGLLDALLSDPERGPAALAFILAHELGHGALGHCRRGYQLQALQQEIKRGINLEISNERLASLLETSLAPAGRLATFLYTREQDYDADRFALHLCRNAGIDPDTALDALRWLVAARHPSVLGNSDAERKPPSLLAYYLATHPDPRRRLERLLMEQSGEVQDRDGLGLFAFDPKTSRLARCPAGAVPKDKACVIFVHGMHGDDDSFRTFLAFLAEDRRTTGRPLLVFRHPGNGSLVHSGRFLRNEMTRVVARPDRATFICHSAGGLVFRYYAEKLHGDFDRAVLLGTPNAGSLLTPLKFLVDAREFASDLKRGLPAAITSTLSEGDEGLTPDVHPDSLFLRHLGHNAKLARRYHLIYGAFLRRPATTAFQVSFELSKLALKRVIKEKVSSPLLRETGLRLVDELRLTDEVLDGDLIVSAVSARLEGAGKMTATRLHHDALKTDADVMALVAASLFGKSGG
jgi:Zn-dependent protease with chaperone function/pimeloyl-ACP methyl ester carboxylesterase